MKQSVVSVRGQTVIPRDIRERLGIRANTRLAWTTRDGIIVVIPLPEDPVRESLGILKGSGLTFQDFLQERRRERALERERDEQRSMRWRETDDARNA